MYWNKEYNTADNDVKHLLIEEGVVMGAFVGLLVVLMVIGFAL